MKFQCPFCQAINLVDFEDCGTNVACATCGSVVTVPPSRVSTSSVISDFIILEELGRGGMGVVYLAHQISLDRAVALKILAEQYARNSEFIVGFFKEARAAAKLNHPHIVQAYAVGEDNGIFFFAMENIDGQTLKQILKDRRRLPVNEALLIMQQISEALAYAWQEAKIIHCDIKPDNIMLTRNGRAKLADLGLARVAGDFDSTSDEVMGTPQYISPEQLTGAPLDGRSDIYSLGATFFHTITGRFAFEGKTATEIARKHLQEELISPKELVPDIPDVVCDIIMKMMAKNPDERYQTADALVEDLRASRRLKGTKLKSNTSEGVSIRLPGRKMNMAKTKVTSGFHAEVSTKSDTISSTTLSKVVKVSTATRNITTDSSAVGPEGKVDTTALNRRRLEEAKTQRIILLIIGMIIFGAVAAATIWYFTRDRGEEAVPPPSRHVAATPAPAAPEKPVDASTDYTLTPYVKEAQDIIAFAASSPNDTVAVLNKCRGFFERHPVPTYDFELPEMERLKRLFVPLDEASLKASRDARSQDHAAAIKAGEGRDKAEQEKRVREELAAWNRAFDANTLESFQKYLDKYPDGKHRGEVDQQIAKLNTEKAEAQKRLDDFSAGLDERMALIRETYPIYIQKRDFVKARKKFEEALAVKKKEGELDPAYQAKADAFDAWAKTMEHSVEAAGKFWRSFSDSDEALGGQKIEIKIRDPKEPATVTTRYYGKVYKIKDGALYLNYPMGSGETMKFMLEDLSFPNVKKDDFDFLAEKFVDKRPELQKSNALFHYYLLTGNFRKAKRFRPEGDDFDWAKEGKFILKAQKDKQ